LTPILQRESEKPEDGGRRAEIRGLIYPFAPLHRPFLLSNRRFTQIHADLLPGRPARLKTLRLKGMRVMDLNEITYKINGAIFEVNKILGPGFLEKVYENALMLELKERGLKAQSQVPINVIYKERSVGEYFADIIVEDEVIIELKTTDKIERIHQAQILNYLKATHKKIGLLVNFKHQKVEIKRMVLNLPERHGYNVSARSADA